MLTLTPEIVIAWTIGFQCGILFMYLLAQMRSVLPKRP
jgi:hypothetical protein